jgi:serine/threonine-protein phosphatase CPPED1
MKISLCLFLLLCSFSLFPAEDNFSYVVIADPQIGLRRDNINDREMFREAAEKINKLEPDFVVIAGDLLHLFFEDSAGDKDWLEAIKNSDYENWQVDAFNRIKKLFKMPVYVIAGNHDVGEKPTRESYGKFIKRFGPIYSSFEHKGHLYILLDSNIMKYPQNAHEIYDTQYAWLRNLLKKSRVKNYRSITVFLHHLPYFSTPKEEETPFTLPVAERETLLGLCRQYGVKYVFTGHLHDNLVVNEPNLEIVTTTATGTKLGKTDPGLRLVNVKGDRLIHRYYPYNLLSDEFIVGLLFFQPFGYGRIPSWYRLKISNHGTASR